MCADCVDTKEMATVLNEIKRGTVALIPESDLVAKLERGTPLTIKLGMDPTAPDLHLGHAVVLRKLRQLQNMGHNIIFIIGDFTARIGDPTGKSKTRPPLSEDQIMHNTKTYFDQVSKILDPSRMIVLHNSQWLDKLTARDMVNLCAKTTLARLTEREDFAERISRNESIGFHELLYPLFQAYDSVHTKADLELGGTDQTFNLLMGRYLQERIGQEPQVILTMPLLEGLDGHAKMSKSLGNAVGISEPADQAFGKLMSVSDELMWRYYKLLLDATDEEILATQKQVASGATHPMDLKKRMAHDIVVQFWSKHEADAAQKSFEAIVQHKDFSHAHQVFLPADTPNPIWIVDLLKKVGAATSSTYARQLIQGKAVMLDDVIIEQFAAEISWHNGSILKAGKHKVFKLVTA